MMRKRRGFTLVEIVVALGLGGLIISLAAAILDSVERAEVSLGQFVEATEASSQQWTRVSQAFAMVEPARPELRTFHGDSLSVSIQTHCRSAWGGLEPCHLILSLTASGSNTQLIVREGEEGSTLVLTLSGKAHWRWLNATDGTAVWQDSWSLEAALPFAGQVVSDTDTLTFIVGAHR